MPSSQPSSQPSTKPSVTPSCAPSPKPTPLPTEAPTRISKPYGYLLLDRYAATDTQCKQNYAFYAIGVGVCAYNTSSRTYYSMYSVFVNKVSVTATISKYNGSLCSGASDSTSLTYSKGTCAIASGSGDSLFQSFMPFINSLTWITSYEWSGLSKESSAPIQSSTASATFSTSVPSVTNGLVIK
jgi:hypothetical protein